MSNKERLTLNNQELTEISDELNIIKTKIDNLPDSSINVYAYPVGSIYTSTSDANPSTLFGGTWEKVGNENELPIEYQQVEYIESTGTQYIDTGYIPNSSTNIHVKYKHTYFENDTNGFLFGSRLSSIQNNISYTSDRNDSYVGRGSNYISAPSINFIDTEYILEYGVNAVTKNGSQLTLAKNLKFTGTNTLVVFACNQNNEIIRNGYFKLFNMKIYDELFNILLNLVPCYRKSDNVIGLYDLVNNKFYTNAGTGEFLKGNKVYLKWERTA